MQRSLVKVTQKAPPKVKYLISGWIRERVAEYKLDYICIVLKLIILIYYWVDEYFTQIWGSDDLEIIDGKTIQSTYSYNMWCFSCYDDRTMGNIKIHSQSNCIASWLFDIDHKTPMNFKPHTFYSIVIHFIDEDNLLNHYEISLMGGWARKHDDGSAVKWSRIAGTQTSNLNDRDLVKVIYNAKLSSIYMASSPAFIPVLITQGVKTADDIYYKIGITICHSEQIVTLKKFEFV